MAKKSLASLPRASLPRKRGEQEALASEKSWFVYILRCADGTFYTGITNDLGRRCKQHNAGTASRYTRSRLPIALVYCEPLPSQSGALKREAAIKSLSREKKELLLVSVEA